MATRVSRTATTSTNETKFTWSAWVKKAKTGTGMMLIYNYLDGNNRGYLQFDTNDKLYYYDKEGGTKKAEFTSSATYKDCSAYYHICVIVDTTDGTEADRLQLYVNGVRQTFSAWTYPSSSATLGFKTDTGTNYVSIGVNSDSTSNPFEGIMSHIHYVDGIDYPATTFGQTDSTTGEWSIKTSSGISTADYGNNGYFILKDGNSVTDQSGNSHNFTVNTGTLTKSEDCPSNIFATFNPLLKTPGGLSYSNGNTTLTTTNTQWEGSISTLAPTKGKWYWEAKYNTGSGIKLDIVRQQADMRFFNTSNNSYGSYSSDGYGYQLNNSGTDYYSNAGTTTTWNSSINSNSTKTYMIAVDLDNGKMWFGANGTWANTSGTANPATGTDPRLSFSAKLNGEPWFFTMSCEGSGSSHNANFGNGYFGTTAVSSAGTNASGIGIFEYDVPTGYSALSTKGLNK